MRERAKPDSTGLDEDRRAQSADYIADMSAELAKLARRSRLDLLAYLLDIASLEARTVGQEDGGTKRGGERVAGAVQG